MTVTNPLGPNEKVVDVDVKRTYEDDPDDSDICFYVETATNLIYDVRLFPECALIRPAHPDFSSLLERISLQEFASKFEEFMGDPKVIQNFMWGAEIDSIEIEKKS